MDIQATFLASFCFRTMCSIRPRSDIPPGALLATLPCSPWETWPGIWAFGTAAFGIGTQERDSWDSLLGSELSHLGLRYPCVCPAAQQSPWFPLSPLLGAETREEIMSAPVRAPTAQCPLPSWSSEVSRNQQVRHREGWVWLGSRAQA